MANDLMKLVQSVLTQKRALDAKERDLIASLNRILPDMGYRVVSTSGAPEVGTRRRGPGRTSAGRAPGAAPKNLGSAPGGRRFSHPLHLGRHTAATHKASGARSARPAAAKRPARGTRSRTRKAARKAS